MNREVLKLSWDTINDLTDSLARIVVKYPPQQIVGITRGGAIPAVMLSHMLVQLERGSSIPVRMIKASTYEGTRRTLQKPTELEGVDALDLSKRTLFVDDLIDSGQTYKAIQKLWTNDHPRFAALINKNPEYHSRVGCTWIMSVAQTTWVQFPWEAK